MSAFIVFVVFITILFGIRAINAITRHDKEPTAKVINFTLNALIFGWGLVLLLK
jgi:hypothetical protein